MAHLWTIPRLWPGADIVILGGGPSVKRIDLEQVKDLSRRGKIKVIGINKAYREFADSDSWMHALWFGDRPFYNIFRKLKDRSLYSFAGLRVTCCALANDPGVKFVGRDDKRRGAGISTVPTAVCWNGNSGSSAINLAYHLGGPTARIFLLGFDMKLGPKGESHWHGGYVEHKKSSGPIQKDIDRWLGKFPMIAADAKKLGLQIINVCIDSGIEQFPKVDWATAYKMIEENLNCPVIPIGIQEEMREGVAVKTLFDARKGDRFLVYDDDVSGFVLDAEGESFLRGVVWADTETGEYEQYYVWQPNATPAERKGLKIATRWGRGILRVVPIMKDTPLTRVDFLGQAIKAHGWTMGAEVGVAKGSTTFTLARRFPGLQLLAVDYWPPRFAKQGARWRREFKRHRGGNVRLINKPSIEAAAEVADGSLDFVFIDADHTEAACRADIHAWFPKVKPCGMLCGHDANWISVLIAVRDELPRAKIFAPDAVWWVMKEAEAAHAGG